MGESDFDWLIVGGGIHGVHHAVRLLAEGAVDPERLVIVDPADELLQRWSKCTGVTGMSYLRSPSVHHLDLHPFALTRFAGKRKDRDPGLFAPPYERPSLLLFQEHGQHVLTKYGLTERHLRDRVVRCELRPQGAKVHLGHGECLTADRLLLAIGSSEQPDWPAWAPRWHARVHHVFAPDFQGWPTPGEVVGVLGGGISAAQVAVRLVREGHQVQLISRHDVREHQFDSDPGWLGPKNMGDFERIRDFRERRQVIRAARHRGSVPPDVRRSLQSATDRGDLQRVLSPVEGLDEAGQRLRLQLAGGQGVEVDRLLLATGFSTVRPGGRMIDELVASADLPCAPCGYPIVDAALRWHPRVHVSGPLAELELGPVSRNIAGARRAADRILGALTEGALELAGRSS